MKHAIVSGSFIVFALLACKAAAQEAQWRPTASPLPQAEFSGIGLRAPIADSSSFQQTSYASTPTPHGAFLVRNNVVDQAPQAMPMGPALQTEKGPSPNPLSMNPQLMSDGKGGEVFVMPYAGQTPPGSNVVPGPGLAPGQPFVQGQPFAQGQPYIQGQPYVQGQPYIQGQPYVQGQPFIPGQPFVPGQGIVRSPGFGPGQTFVQGPGTGPEDCGCGETGGLKGWFTKSRHGVCDDQCGVVCDPCACLNGCCAPRDCFWVSAEYLLWFTKGSPLPPLATINGTPGALPVLGVPGTVVGIGGSRDSYDPQHGGRVTIGFGFPCTDNWLGLEGTFFMLGNRTSNQTLSSTGVPSIGRPFTNVGPGLTGFPGNQDAELVALANVLSGAVNVSTSSQLWGAELNFRMPITCGCNWKLDFLTGFRYLQLNEDLQIVENLTVIPPTFPNGENGQFGRVGNFIVVDRFSTRNSFYGGQIGLDAECRWKRCFIGGTGKLALGCMQQSVDIDGSTTFRDGPNPGTESGGLLALPGTNIGNHSRSSFTVLPELGLKVGLYFTEHFRGYIGYNILYVSNVVRPGDQIDLHVNPTYLPRNGPPVGVPAPQFQFRSSDFWAQGVSVGLELRY